MKILLIHQIFVTPEYPGGTRHYELAHYLVKQGHDVTVIASNIDYLSGKKKHKKKEIIEGIKIIYAQTYHAVHKSFIARAISFITFSFSSFFHALTVRKIDIIWGTSPPIFQALTALFVAKIRRKYYIFEVRDLWIDFARELKVVKNPMIIYSIKLIERILYRYSDKIIINSPGFLPFVEKHAAKEKIALIPNGVNTFEFNIDPESSPHYFWEKYKLSSYFIASYIGNLGLANNIRSILDAAEILKIHPQIKIILLGGGMLKEKIKEEIEERELSNVLLLDAEPKSEIPKILNKIDVGIATLKNIKLFRTTYPNKVFDYMAAKKPTILGIKGVIETVITNAEAGICVEPENAEEIAAGILCYYQNESLKIKHGENAYKYVCENFEREIIAAKFEKLIKESFKKK